MTDDGSMVSGHGAGFVDLSPRSPIRPLSWRWELAGLEGRLAPRRWCRGDGWVATARRLRRALARPGWPGCRGPGRTLAAALVAYRIYTGVARARREVEARLVAGQDDAEVADRMGLDPGAVAAFEAIFFSVRSRIEASDWIASFVFGARLYDGRGADDPDLAARLVAYNFGGLALDCFLGHPVVGVDAPRVAEALRRYVRAATAPVTTRDAPRWLAVTARMADLAREQADSRLAAVSGPIGVRATLPDDLFAADRSAVRAGFELRRTDDDDPAINIPSIVAMSLDDLLDRRSA